MSTSLLDELKEDINERQDELFSVQIALEDEACKASNFAKYLRRLKRQSEEREETQMIAA